ncbi:hypothetical protein PG988_006810 [Apiospora saccharicola]
MSGIINDVKSGLKGIRGAGDAIRGTAMEKTDQAFDNDAKHPQTQLSQAQHRDIIEKGKQDIAGTDHMVGRHEQKKDAKAAAAAGIPSTTQTTTTKTTTTGAAPGTTAGAGLGERTTEASGVNSHVV